MSAAAVAAVLAVFVFVLTQSFLKLVLEPVQEQRRLIGEVAHALLYYANVMPAESLNVKDALGERTVTVGAGPEELEEAGEGARATLANKSAELGRWGMSVETRSGCLFEIARPTPPGRAVATGEAPAEVLVGVGNAVTGTVGGLDGVESFQYQGIRQALYIRLYDPFRGWV